MTQKPATDLYTARRRSVQLYTNGLFMAALKAVASADGLSVGEFIVQELTNGERADELRNAAERLRSKRLPNT